MKKHAENTRPGQENPTRDREILYNNYNNHPLIIAKTKFVLFSSASSSELEAKSEELPTERNQPN
jgi:hypothetical protein